MELLTWDCFGRRLPRNDGGCVIARHEVARQSGRAS